MFYSKEKKLNFKDVLIVPKLSKLNSRKDVFEYCTKSLSVDFFKIGSSIFSNDVWYRKRSETDYRFRSKS